MGGGVAVRCFLGISAALAAGVIVYVIFLHNWDEKGESPRENIAGKDRIETSGGRMVSPPISDLHDPAIHDSEIITSRKEPSLFPRKRKSIEKQNSSVESPEGTTVLPDSVLRETRERSSSDGADITIETDGNHLTPDQRRRIESLMAERDKMLDEIQKTNIGEMEKASKMQEMNDRVNGKIQSVLRGEEE